MVNDRKKLIRKIGVILQSNTEDITAKSYAITYAALAEDDMINVLKKDQRLNDIVDLATQIEGDATDEEKALLYEQLIDLFEDICND